MRRGAYLTGKHRSHLAVAAVMAALAIMSPGCAANRSGAQPLWPTSVPEIDDATLSPDGHIIALTVPPPEGSASVFGEAWFVDAVNGRLISQAPGGLAYPRWGPGNGYWSNRVYRIDHTIHASLYWSPAAAVAPQELHAFASLGDQEVRVNEVRLEPTLQYVILAIATAARSPAPEDVEAAEVFAIPLHGDRPQLLLQAPYYIATVGAVTDPRDPQRSLALITGPKEGPDAQPGIVAVEVPSGKVRWRAPLDLSGARGWTVVSGSMAYLVMERLTPGTTELWQVDPAQGLLKLIARIASSYRFATPLPAGGPHPVVYLGGTSDIWQIDPASPSPKAEKILEGGGAGLRPLGARLNAAGHVELFMFSEHAVWRCRPDTGACEVVLGHSLAGEARPRFVRRAK